VLRIFGDSVATLAQQLQFGMINTVLAPGPLIVVVGDENSHPSLCLEANVFLSLMT